MSEAGGRVAMISGASRGIGAAVARRLAAEGWRLSLGARDPGRVAVAAGADTMAHVYDADAAAEPAWVAATLARFGRIDAVINNAGLMIPKTVVEATDDDLMAMFQVHVRSPLRLVRAAWAPLVASGQGRVITIASLSGKRVKSAASGLYAITKFAAVGMSHAIRQAGWEAGVRATAICPGFVATDMGTSVTQVPAERMTQPDDLARVIALLLDLPNTASVSEFAVNALLDDSY